MFQRQFRIHVLEPAVFCFQLTQAANVGGFHAAVLCLPLVIGCVTDFVFATTSLTVWPASTAFKMAMICVSLNLLFRIRPPGVILARKPLLFNGPVLGEGYTHTHLSLSRTSYRFASGDCVQGSCCNANLENMRPHSDGRTATL